MITLDQIRTKLKEAIKQSPLTQTEICKQLGIKPPTLSQYLSGRAMPALDTFANLCLILDIPSDEILCITDNTGNKTYINNSFNNFSNNGNFKI